MDYKLQISIHWYAKVSQGKQGYLDALEVF